MSFFKLAMIVWLKIYAKGKIFDKIFLKLSETFLQYVVCNQGTNGGTRLFGGGDIQQNKKLLGLQRAPKPPPHTHTHTHTHNPPNFVPYWDILISPSGKLLGGCLAYLQGKKPLRT